MTLEERRRLLSSIPTNDVTPETIGTSADPRSDAQKILDNIATGGYEATNSILMGLPDFLMKNIGGSKAYKVIEEMRKRNPEAATVGDVGGLVGSMFIPGGAIAKGLGAGLKGVGAVKAGEGLMKAGEFLKGTELAGNLGQKVATGALRGAGQAAEQAIPRALTNLDFTEGGQNLAQSAQEGASSIPLSMGIGAAGGAVLGPLAQKLLGKTSIKGQKYGETLPEFATNEVKEALDKATLAQAGIESRALKTAARNAGFGSASRSLDGADYINELAQGLRDRGIRGKRGFEALVAKNRQAWSDIDDAFIKNAPADWNKDLSNKLATDNDLLQLVDEQDTEAATKAFTDIVSSISKNGNLPVLKNKLGNIIRKGLNSQDSTEKEKAFVANQIKKKLDDYVADLSGLDVAEAKAEYKLVQPFLQQELRDFTKIGKANGGSPTFEKAAIASLIGAAGGGSSVAGDISSGQDIDVPKALMQTAGGAIAGQAATKILPGILNKATSEAGRAAGGILSKPGVQEAVESGISRVPEVATKTAAVGIPQSAKEPAKAEDDPAKTVEAKEQAMPQEQVQKTRAEFSQKFASTLNEKLRTIYNTYYSNIDPQEFLAQVAQKTNNFSDMNQMANILFLGKDKEKEAFLRKYDAYLALKNVDIDKAIKGQSSIEGLLGQNKEAKEARDVLVNTLMNLQTEGDVSKRTPAQTKILEDYISKVRSNPKLMNQFMKDYGLDFNDLSQFGLA